MEQNNNAPQRFTLEEFKKSSEGMVRINTVGRSADNHYWRWMYRSERFSPEQVQQIVSGGTPEQRRLLSRQFFNEDGFYRQIVLHYGTLLKNMGILIPNLAFGTKSLQDTSIAKRVHGANNLVERMNLKKLLTKNSVEILLDGSYAGIITKLSKTEFALLQLPFEYYRVRFKDSSGRDIVEFNMHYFERITDQKDRKAALRAYPPEVTKYYNAWVRRSSRAKSEWMFLPTDLTVYFELFNNSPYFLPLIPNILEYDEAVENEAKKSADEIKKLIVQKIPHLNDGRLVFEPVEAEEMHVGAVGMLQAGNENISVLTTYGDVTALQTKTTDSVTHTALEQMSTHLYSSSGVSPQIFAATGASSLSTSLSNDLSIMMTLGNQYGSFVSRVVNKVYANSQIDFKYNFLGVTHHNEKDFIDNSFKLAQSGYSLYLPAIAQGLSQRDLMNLKDLENDCDKLTEKLIPLQSAYTQSSGDGAGRPELDEGEKSDKTRANEESLGNKGG